MKKRIFSLLLALCLVAGMLPTVAYAVYNYDTIDSGEYSDDMENLGEIRGGTFNGVVTNNAGGSINGGTFNSTVNNRGGSNIYNGIFNSTVNNESSIIHGGTFYGAVTNEDADGAITGGTFYGAVTNECDIEGGTFYGTVNNDGAITGGTFYGTITGSGTVTGATYRRIVTFDSNGGSEVPSKDILKDSTVTEPTDPTKAGYSFEGWYNGDTEFDFVNTPVTENIALTAKWSIVWTELTKDILESPTYKQTTSLGNYIYVLPSGNYYLGEDISVNTTIRIGTTSTSAEVVLNLKGYKLENNTNSATVLNPINSSTLTLTDSSSGKTGKVISNSGCAVNISKNCTLNANGGTIKGETENDGVIANTDSSNVTVFEDFVHNNKTINNGIFYGNVDNSNTISGGTFYGDVENNSTITGGTFYGAVSGSGTISDSAVIWKKLTKAVLDNNYKQQPSGSDIYVLPSGHYYLGEDISVNISVDIRDRFNDADVTLDLNGHTLTNSCTDSPAIFVNGNHSLTLMDSSAGETGRFTGAGKEVIGIYVNGGSFVMAGGTVDGFILDVFICEGGTFTMTGGTLKGTADGGALHVAGKIGSNYADKAIMYADGGTVDGDAKFQNCTVEKSPSAASETVFNGKVTIMGGGNEMVTIRCGVFCGTVENGGEITGGIFYGGLTHIVDSDGKLGENAHAITFMDGVTQYAIEVLDSGVASYAPDAPTQTGCSFDGWYNGDTEYTFGSPITEGLTLNAHWTFNPYTITLDANGGTVELSTLTTGDGWKLTGDLPTPTRDGYTFAGWFTKAEGGTAVINATVFDKDTTICAHWIVNQYTITFETDGGSEIAPIIQDYGTDVTAPGNPTKPGYTFAGWEPEIPDTMPAEDMTITAKWTKNSSGGSSTPTYAPTVTQPENGSVTVSPKSPRKGVTVTITPTPDAGYTVEQILVTDKNGDPVEVINNGDGTYSFTQPAGKVNINVTFMEDNSMLNFFVDVPADAYYYDAVLWAAENGITGGVDDIHFAPNDPCTRAQIVTFLWRAAGCPEPESLISLSDVPADAYYAKAVAWALENGITTGTGDGTTFSPNATCTRAQAMAFIYRSEQARGGGMQGAWMFLNPFDDVNLESYYGEAVMWAVANGVTDGTTATTFSPNANCTRAQIVTFLYRFFVK